MPNGNPRGGFFYPTEYPHTDDRFLLYTKVLVNGLECPRSLRRNIAKKMTDHQEMIEREMLLLHIAMLYSSGPPLVCIEIIMKKILCIDSIFLSFLGVA